MENYIVCKPLVKPKTKKEKRKHKPHSKILKRRVLKISHPARHRGATCCNFLQDYFFPACRQAFFFEAKLKILTNQYFTIDRITV